MKKKIVVIVICIGILAVIVVKLSCNKQKIIKTNKPLQDENVRIPVTAMAVSEEQEEIKVIKTGKVTPEKEARVLSITSGNILRMQFKLGDKVHKGQTLAIIDTRLLQLDLQKAESVVSRLKDDLQTYTELLEGNAATKEKVNEIRRKYEDAGNQVQQIQRQIADASIKSPISGTIYAKPMEEGMFVASGAEIAAVVDMSSLKVEVYLTEAEVYQVGLGQKINLTTDVYPHKIFEGKVNFISPQGNETYNYFVEIRAANDNAFPLRSGTFVNADFSKNTTRKIILIPREALNESTQDASVYVTENGKAILRKIKVGAEYGNKIQVISGLQPSELVITSGQINLKDGALINVSK